MHGQSYKAATKQEPGYEANNGYIKWKVGIVDCFTCFSNVKFIYIILPVASMNKTYLNGAMKVLAALVQLFVHLVKLTFNSLASSSRSKKKGHLQLASTFILRPASAFFLNCLLLSPCLVLAAYRQLKILFCVEFVFHMAHSLKFTSTWIQSHGMGVPSLIRNVLKIVSISAYIML